jgi:hypothetical protein
LFDLSVGCAGLSLVVSSSSFALTSGREVGTGQMEAAAVSAVIRLHPAVGSTRDRLSTTERSEDILPATARREALVS